MWFSCFGGGPKRTSPPQEPACVHNGDVVHIKAANDAEKSSPTAPSSAINGGKSIQPAGPSSETIAAISDATTSTSQNAADAGINPSGPPSADTSTTAALSSITPGHQHGTSMSPRSNRGGAMSPKELFNDITNLIFLGAGAYGSVYEGMWHGAVVAIKFIRSDTLDAKCASAREATFSNMLAHPHVVQTFWSRSARIDEEFMDAALKEHMQQRSVAQNGNSFVSNEGFGDPNKMDNGREARMAATTYGVLQALGVKPGQYMTAIAMEYMDNCSLHEVVAQGLFQANSKWGPRIVLRALSRTAREVARGMWHLHSSGVIHGDLKPANVLLKHSRADRRGFVCKVSDFGLSRECLDSERLVSAETWGTVSYMAPEHFRGQLCQASDVYSFGVMLQEMYTSERPHKNYMFGQIMMGVQSGQLKLQWPPGAPTALATLSQRCMAFNAADRPTFDVIIEELNSMETALRMEEYSRRTNLEEDGSIASRDSSQTKLSINNDSSSQSVSMKVPRPPNDTATTNSNNNNNTGTDDGTGSGTPMAGGPSRQREVSAHRAGSG